MTEVNTRYLYHRKITRNGISLDRLFDQIKGSMLINNKKFGDTDLKPYQLSYSNKEFGAKNEQP